MAERPQSAAAPHSADSGRMGTPLLRSTSRTSMISGKTSWFQSSPCSSHARCSASTAIRSSANTRSVKRRMNGQAR